MMGVDECYQILLFEYISHGKEKNRAKGLNKAFIDVMVAVEIIVNGAGGCFYDSSQTNVVDLIGGGMFEVKVHGKVLQTSIVRNTSVFSE